MATRIDFKLAPAFDIENESHLFKQWKLMWFGYEALSGLADIADDATKKLKRLQSFRLAVSKETLKLVEHLPIKDKEDLDEILSAMEDHIVGTTNEVFERREFWKRTQQGESFSY